MKELISNLKISKFKQPLTTRGQLLAGAVCGVLIIIPVLFIFNRPISNLHLSKPMFSSVYAYENTQLGFELDLLKKDDSTHLFTATDPKSKSSLSLYLKVENSETKNSRIEDSDSLTISDILPHTDLTYRVIANGVKEDIVLKSKEALTAMGSDSLAYVFNLSLSGLKIHKLEDGTISPKFQIGEGSESFELLPLYMEDASGVISHEVGLAIEESEQPDVLNITVTPSMDWLSDPARVFPIRIDPSVVKGDAPVAQWSMDEGYGTTTNDGSTNLNHLTITNATWEKPSDRTSASSATYIEFDGTGDYLSRTSDADFDFGTGSFSLSGWFKHNSTAALDIIMAHTGAVNGIGWKVYLDASGYLCFGIDDDTSSFPEKSACSTSTQGSLADSRWHHFEAVKSGTTSITIYLDGKPITTTSIAGTTGTLTNSVTLHIGIDGDASTNAWTGFLDNLTIYNYERTAAQVQADALAVSSAQASVSFGAAHKDTLTDGLVGWWKMDESSGNVTDYSGNALTLTNNGTTTFDGGKFGNGSEHVPASSQYLSTATTISGIKTVSIWVNPDSTTNYLASLTSSAYVTSSSGTISATGFTSPTIYVNGIQSTTLTADVWQQVTVTTEMAINADTFYLGRQSTDYYDGSLDDVRIYNRALSPAEVRQLYNWAPGPVAYYSFDENTGLPADTGEVKDRSGNANHGEMESSMTASDWVPGKFGSALDFDGTNDYINAGSASGLDTVTSGTISLWIYPDAANTEWIYPVAKDNSGTNNGDINIAVVESDDVGGNANKVRFFISSGSTDYYIFGNSAVTFNQWVHVTGTFGTGGMKLYLNGVLQDDTDANTIGMENASADLILGSIRASTGPFDGKIDDIRIYNYVRTPAQIIEDMNGGHPMGGSPVGSSVGYWKFDEGYGDTANDSSPQGNNGDLSGSTTCPSASICPTWSTAGKYNNALNLTGLSTGDGDSLVRLGTDMFDSLTEGSVSLWINPEDTGDADQAIFSVAEDDNHSWSDVLTLEYVLASNTVGLYVNNNDDWEVLDFSTPITPNQWTHLVLTMNSGGNKMYINGLPITPTYVYGSSTTNVWFDDVSDSTTAYIVGCVDADGSDSNDCSDDNYTGLIDELKVYSSALTPEQVLTEYNHGKATVMGSTSTASDGITADNSQAREFCVPGDTTSCSAPVGWWKMDENTGTTSTYDSSGNGNTGTLNGSMTANDWVKGKLGSALDFDGSDDFVSVTDVSALNPTLITVEAWFKARDISGQSFPPIIKKASATTGYSLEINNSTSALALWIRVGGSFYSSPTYTTSINTWYHVAGTYDGTTLRLFVDGNEVSTGTAISGTIVSPTSQPLQFGQDAGNPTRFFDGLIDDVRIYNYARTPAQIAWDYNRGEPVVHYKLDECTGSIAYNSAKTGNGVAAGMDGTITIGSGGTNTDTTPDSCTAVDTADAWYNGANGKRNASLDFDGTDDYIATGTGGPPLSGGFSSAFNLSNFTYSFWTNMDDVSATNQFFLELPISGPNARSWFWWNDTNEYGLGTDKLILGWYTGSVWTDNTFDWSPSADRWYMVTATFDGTTLEAYIDGVSIGTSTPGTTPVSADAAVLIGTQNDQDATPHFLDGQIDEVKIWNYALTAKQVQLEYNQGAVNFAP